MERFIGLFGILSFIFLAWLISTDRRRVSWRLVAAGLLLQLLLGLLILGVPALGIPGPLSGLFQAMNTIVMKLIAFSDAGSAFVFGHLVDPEKAGGFIVAVKVLPTIIFFSSLASILYYVGVLQWVVKGMAVVMNRLMGTSGAESLSAAANVFIGQTEAPLLVRPFIPTMTRSELMALMTGGMATVAGGVLAAYVGLLSGMIPDIAGHLITASVMSAPASLLMAKILVPEVDTPQTRGRVELHVPKTDANVIDAAASGASTGLKLALNVAAMLIAFIALLELFNAVFGWFGDITGIAVAINHPLSFQWIVGWIFTPLSWLMGVPSQDTFFVGQLLGEKIILNEFVAYLSLATNGGDLTPRGAIIASYALCGFANFGSIAIQLGGIGALAPERRGDLARLGLRSLVGGTFAACMTATIAGLLV